MISDILNLDCSTYFHHWLTLLQTAPLMTHGEHEGC